MRTKDNTELVVFIGIMSSVSIIVLILLTNKTGLQFDGYTAAVATTIGEIVGSVFASLTLLIIATSYKSDIREKTFRQTLDLTEKLIKVYTTNYQQYISIGKNALVFGPSGLESGDIFTYLKPTQALFSAVMAYLDKGQFSDIQSQALVSILMTELRPMVEEMNEEIDRLGRDRALKYNQVAQNQLLALEDVEKKAGLLR
jgi:gas vesicle protein